MVKKNAVNNSKPKSDAQENAEINDIAVKKQFAANLSTLMEQKHITGKQLHEATGYSEATISGMKNGNKSPTLGFLLELKRLYGISIDDFLSKNILPDVYDSEPSTSKLEENERKAYAKFVGTYYLYYFDTSSYKGHNYDSPADSLRFGILHIYATPSSLDKFNHSVVCITGIQTREKAIEIRHSIDDTAREGGDIPSYIHDRYPDFAYYGDFDMSPDHVFISFRHTNKDKAMIILHRPISNKSQYNSGIGTINSISRGREATPTIQFIGLSREDTRLSNEELHQMLLLDHISIKDSPVTEDLINVIKKLYRSNDDSISDFQRDIMVKGAITAYVRKVGEANFFRVAKISNRDDDTWYHKFKDSFIDN